MTLLTAVAHLLRSSVSIAPWSSQDFSGVPTYGDAVTYAARVVGRVRIVRALNGDEVVSTKTIYLAENVNVGTKDQITLSTNETPQSPPIIAVGRYPDSQGEAHTVIYL